MYDLARRPTDRQHSRLLNLPITVVVLSVLD